MAPERRHGDQYRVVGECEDRHKEERQGRRWAVGLLTAAIIVIFGASISWAIVVAGTDGTQNAQLAERAKAESRILDKLDRIERLILERCTTSGD